MGARAADQCLVEMITDELLGGWRHALAMAKALYMLALYEHAYLFSVSLNTHSQSFQKYPVATEEFETGFTYCMEAKQ